MWCRKYDKAFGWQAQRERELGSKFRKNKAINLQGFGFDCRMEIQRRHRKEGASLELVARNDEANVTRLTGQALSVPGCEDSYRMNCLTLLEGVSPILASVILTFFDPKQYCILDTYTWKALLGNVPPNMQTIQNYLKLLAVIRKSAAKQNLDVRVIDKAFFKKGSDKSS